MSDEIKHTYRKIKIGEVRLDPIRGPEVRDESLVEMLVESIDTYGVLQAPIVRKVPKGRGKGYWLIAGARRFAAAKKDPTRSTLDCRVVVCDDEAAREIFLRENLERSHISAEQRSAARQELIKVIDRRERADRVAPGRAFRIKNAAKATGVCERTVERYDRFAEKLIPEARAALREGEINTKEADALCRMSERQQESELPVLVQARAEGKPRRAPVPRVQERRPVVPGTVCARVSSFLSAVGELVNGDLVPILVSSGLDAAMVDVEPDDIRELSNVFLRLNDLVSHLPPEVVMHSVVLSEVSRALEDRWTPAGVVKAKLGDPMEPQDSSTVDGEGAEKAAPGRVRPLIPGLKRNQASAGRA